jgi:hypothetical protein
MPDSGRDSPVMALREAARRVLDCGVGNLNGDRYRRRVEAFDALDDALDALATPDDTEGPRKDAPWAEQVIQRWAPDERSRAIEARARELAGPSHRVGAIPARFWREAIEAEAATAARSDGIDVEMLINAVIAISDVNGWNIYDTASGGVVWVDRHRFATSLAAEYARRRSGEDEQA